MLTNESLNRFKNSVEYFMKIFCSAALLGWSFYEGSAAGGIASLLLLFKSIEGKI